MSADSMQYRGGAEPEVVFTVPCWEVSGVTSVTVDLAGALQQRGLRCRILVEEDNRAASPFEVPAGCSAGPLPGGLAWWRLSPSRSWAWRWRCAMARRKFSRELGVRSPVAWFPGYSYSLLTPAIAAMKGVGIFAAVHSDDETNLGFAREQGRSFARLVCVSERLAGRVGQTAPWLRPLVRVIPNGVACPADAPLKARAGGSPLRVVYAGRLEQHQKRIHDLPKLARQCAGRGLVVQWEIAGEGPEGETLRQELGPEIDAGRVRWHGPLKRDAVRALFQEADATVLLSNFEGMPIALLEAMAAGCVPLVSEGCDAGADLVRASGAGFVVPTGDLNGFTDSIAALCAWPGRLEELSFRSWKAVASGPHNLSEAAARYDALIREWADSEGGSARPA